MTWGSIVQKSVVYEPAPEIPNTAESHTSTSTAIVILKNIIHDSYSKIRIVIMTGITVESATITTCTITQELIMFDKNIDVLWKQICWFEIQSPAVSIGFVVGYYIVSHVKPLVLISIYSPPGGSIVMHYSIAVYYEFTPPCTETASRRSSRITQ